MRQHKPRKRFGQHFLVNPQIITQIVAAINPSESDHIVEIGPGLGALTSAIVSRVQHLDAIELDRDLVPILAKKFSAFPSFRLYQADALAFDYANLTQQLHGLRLVGNLPYQISTPLLFHLINYAPFIRDMHFMLQKEVVMRMGAETGSEFYGRLSVNLQYYCRVEPLFLVGPEAFDPPPRVDSQVVRLIPHTTLPARAADMGCFSEIVRTAFSQRRKMLRKSLKSMVQGDMLTAVGIALEARPEDVSVQQFVALANLVSQKSVI